MRPFEQVAAYMVAQQGATAASDIPGEILFALNHLNRAERGNLKAWLFNQAKKMSLNGTAHDALFWLENCYLLIEKHTYRFHQVFFSPGTDIPETILGMIQSAEQTIDLCIFTISHYELASELGKAHRRGVRVRLLTDDQKQYDKGSRIKTLSHEGIAIKTDDSRYHMHHKFGLIDRRTAFTGSFNWTYTATKHNQENLLVTTNYDIVKQYHSEFERLWESMQLLWG
jgi:phosphatidylserine/phosphatidylglycerophosphate/cardiolipin synthase-like enzyme